MMFAANRKHIFVLFLCLVLTLGVASCGDEEAPTPTPAPPTTAPTVAPTATTAPPTDTPAPTATPQQAEAAAAEQPASPLGQESPLPTPAESAQQPASPLAGPLDETACAASTASASGNSQISVISDPALIERVTAAMKSPEPQAGKAAASALLYSYSEDRVIPGTQFYLTKGLEDGDNVIPPAVYLGPKEEKGDVLGFTDGCGRLFLDNIPPGKYYLAVWTVYDWLLAFDKKEDEMPLLITAEAGDQLDLGKLEVDWP